MGNKYQVEAWGRHYEGEDAKEYSMKEMYRGEWLIPALYALWKAKLEFGMVQLKVRG